MSARIRLPVVSSLLFLGVSATVWAQGASLALEEIIVTAQKREQSIQDVPIAITAFSQEMLVDRNVYDLIDLQRLVPSMIFVEGYNRANGTPLVIRGMGTIAAQPAFEGSVGTYVDGVYRSRPGMVLSSMLDMGRIEVLRGPQGTLFGKNTTAGAITLTSNEPQREFGYSGEATFGDYDRRRFSGHVTGPISDSLSARLAVLSDQRDGFIDALFEHNDYNDLDIASAKLSLLWEPDANLSATVIADISDSEEVCCFGNPVWFQREQSLTGGPFNDYYREAAQANFDTDIDLLALDPDDRENQNNTEPRSDSREEGLVLDVSYRFNDVELRSLTGVRNWEYSTAGDFDFGPVDIGFLVEDYDVDFLSQEFTLAGSTNEWSFLRELEYVAGLFYASESFQQHRAFNAGVDQAGIWELFFPAQVGLPEPALRALLGGGDWATPGLPIGDVFHDLETETAAAFVHLTAALTSELSLILGLRYTDEEKTMDRNNLLFSDVQDYSAYLQENMLGAYVLGANIAGPDMEGLEYSDDEWTYDIKLQYYLAPVTQMYGGYSRGFKSGGIGMDPEAGGGQPSGLNSALLLQLAGMGNGTGFADLNDPTYDTEYVDTWEVGLKSAFLQGRGRVNLAIFYNEIEDNQFSVFTGTGFRVLNASSADIPGVEVETFFAATEHLRLGASATWLDSEYGDDIPEPAEPGRELTYAPDWSAALSLDYERPVTQSLSGFFNLNWSYRGDQYLSYDIPVKQSAFDLLGMQIGVSAASDAWDLRFWCDNCLDERYATGYFNQPFYFDDNLEQYRGQFPGQPRTYGVTLRITGG